MEILGATIVLFALGMLGLGVGVLLSNKPLEGSCGAGIVDADGDEIACGLCSRKEASVCPSDDPLVRLAQIAHPNPEHHR